MRLRLRERNKDLKKILEGEGSFWLGCIVTTIVFVIIQWMVGWLMDWGIL